MMQVTWVEQRDNIGSPHADPVWVEPIDDAANRTAQQLTAQGFTVTDIRIHGTDNVTFAYVVYEAPNPPAAEVVRGGLIQ